MKLVKLKLLGICVASTLLLSACPNALEPFNPAVVNQAKDATAPVIEIISPVNNTIYGQVVTVAGRIADDGAVSSLSWTVSGPLGALDKGTVPAQDIGADGSFSFSFPAASYSSSIMVKVDAADWNGNTAAESISLNYSGSAIPTFTASPGNKSVTLSWDSVPGADTYTVYYTKNGNLPSTVYSETPLLLSKPPAASAPLLVNDLENGQTHVFLLKAAGAGGEEWMSEYISAVPSSLGTFTPVVTGGHERIKIEWDNKTSVSAFEVWRSESENGIYNNISGEISKSFFYDSMVEPEVMYYYKVKPAGGDAGLSGSASARIYPYTVSEITELFSFGLEGSAYDIEVSDDYAYIAAGGDGLQIFDLKPSRSTYQTLVWACGTEGDALNIDVLGDYAYIAEGAAGVEIFRIAEGGNAIMPVQCSHFNPDLTPPAYAYDVAMNVDDDRCLLIADGMNGLQLVNVSNKAAPFSGSKYPSGSSMVISLAYESDYVSIVDSWGGIPEMKRVDISNLSAPVFNNGFSVTEAGDPPFEIEVAGNYLYAGGYGYLFILNKETGVEQAKIKTSGVVTDIEVEGNRLYVLEGRTAVRVVDITVAATPVSLDLQSYNKTFNSITVDGSRLLCGNDDGGITVLGDVSLSEAVDSGNVLATPRDLLVSGEKLYVADKGIRQFDLNSGSLTGDSAYYNTYNGSSINKVFNSLDEQNGIIYATYSKSLMILDSSSPGDYTSCELPDNAKGVVVRGDYAYVGTDFQGLFVVDISNVNAPFIAGFCDTNGQAGSLVISGDTICLDDGTEGIALLDISNPSDPKLKGTCQTASTVFDVALLGDYVVAAVADGLQVFDISIPVSPVKIGELPVSLSINGIRVEAVGDNVFLYDSNTDTLNVISAIDPKDPHIVKTIAMEDLHNLVVSGSKIYILDNGKLKYIDISL